MHQKIPTKKIRERLTTTTRWLFECEYFSQFKWGSVLSLSLATDQRSGTIPTKGGAAK